MSASRAPRGDRGRPDRVAGSRRTAWIQVCWIAPGQRASSQVRLPAPRAIDLAFVEMVLPGEWPVDDRLAVLVVDDDPDIRETLREVIEAEGFPVVTAAH